MTRIRFGALALLLLIVAGALMVGWLGLREDTAGDDVAPRIAADLRERAARGAYLARAGNCRGCHTERGGADYAGGRVIATPFGEFRAPNITPDREHGIGGWSEADFWRALHDGKRPDGTPLYPVFPYTHFTRISREDVGAIFAYLQSVPASGNRNLAHSLRFPYDQRWLLVAWRALFFRPGVYRTVAAQDERWNRGAYLVQWLGHCGACHAARNSLGAIRAADNPAGGVVLNWYAPALDSSCEAGVAAWTEDEVVALLQSGVNRHASTLGPMAEVVYGSLQFLRDDDARAMAAYLRALPDRAAPADAAASRQTAVPQLAENARGAKDYAEHCAECHGKQGEGRAPATRALAGNRAVTMASAMNPIRIVLQGGYPPGTGGNPQPFGMPQFGATLSDQQIADILSYIRSSWGNAAPAVHDYEVTPQRGGILW